MRRAMYKYLFGPVPSRRLGMSLGVDLVPRKVCSLDCVYCEVGKTNRLTTERKEYILFREVQEELEDFFEHEEDPDYITFSGSGEPTLNSKFKDVLNFIKKIKPGIPIAVLTNGTLLSRKEVRDEMKGADVVLPSLDAVTEDAFRKINRPADELSIDEYIEGLVKFSNEFEGKIWLEVFILPGYNDDREHLMKMKKVLERIRADTIQLNTLDRPGTVSDLHPASKEELQAIKDMWGLDNVEIIASAKERKKKGSYSKAAAKGILETIARRPCTADDLSDMMGLHQAEINKYLDILDEENKIETVEEDRGIFYKLKE